MSFASRNVSGWSPHRGINPRHDREHAEAAMFEVTLILAVSIVALTAIGMAGLTGLVEQITGR